MSLPSASFSKPALNNSASRTDSTMLSFKRSFHAISMNSFSEFQRLRVGLSVLYPPQIRAYTLLPSPVSTPKEEFTCLQVFPSFCRTPFNAPSLITAFPTNVNWLAPCFSSVNSSTFSFAMFVITLPLSLLIFCIRALLHFLHRYKK